MLLIMLLLFLINPHSSPSPPLIKLMNDYTGSVILFNIWLCRFATPCAHIKACPNDQVCAHQKCSRTVYTIRMRFPNSYVQFISIFTQPSFKCKSKVVYSLKPAQEDYRGCSHRTKGYQHQTLPFSSRCSSHAKAEIWEDCKRWLVKENCGKDIKLP